MKQKSIYYTQDAAELTQGIQGYLYEDLDGDQLYDFYTTHAADLNKWVQLHEGQNGYGAIVPLPFTLPVKGSLLNGNNFLKLPKGDASLYRYASPSINVFHPLCRFLRMSVRYECRLIVSGAEYWREGFPNALLRYELNNLEACLSDLIEECASLLSEKEMHTSLPERLKRYKIRILLYELICLSAELKLRFESFMECPARKPGEIYADFLYRGIDSDVSFYPTRYLLRWYLQCLNTIQDTENQLVHIKETIMGFYADDKFPAGEEEKAERIEICRILENTMLVYLVRSLTAHVELFGIFKNPEENAGIITQWRDSIEIGADKTVIEALSSVAHRFEKMRSGIMAEMGKSEAAGLIEDFYVAFAPDKDKEGRAQSQQKPERNGSFLDDYIPLDELREKLGVSLVTMNNYLKDSGIVDIRLSAKTRFLHKDEVQKLFDYFKRTQTDAHED